MNDNPGGTPNPLNPNLATGSAPTPQGPAGQRPVQQTINPVFSTPRPMNPVAPNQPMNFGATEQPTAPVVGSQAQMPAGQTPQMSQMPQAQPNDPYSPAFGMQNQPQPVAQPSIQNMANGQAFMSPQTPLNEPNDQNMNQGTVTPTSQPMMESAQVKSPKKTSKVTIILAIILLIIALGCAAVAVILFVLPNNSVVASDAVPAAIEKLIKTGGTRNVEMSGSVNLSGDNTSVDALIDAKYGDGNVVADADISLSTSDLNLAFKLSEITMSKNGVGYVKYDGLYKALEGEVLEKVKDYCNTEEECKEIAAEALKEFNAVSVVDGKWIKIETSDVETFLSDFVPASSFKCLVDTTGEIGDYSDEILSLYKENPFISYSTADINLASKGGQLYQLTIDAEKFTNFVNSMKTVGYANSLRACMGEEATLGDATTSEVAEMLENIPDIFVEIDDNYHFTRVYFNVPSTTSMSAIMVDLSFSYPDIITVSEPTEYVNANDAMKDLFNILYQAS